MKWLVDKTANLLWNIYTNDRVIQNINALLLMLCYLLVIRKTTSIIRQYESAYRAIIVPVICYSIFWIFLCLLHLLYLHICFYLIKSLSILPIFNHIISHRLEFFCISYTLFVLMLIFRAFSYVFDFRL